MRLGVVLGFLGFNVPLKKGLSRDAKYLILRVDCEFSREILICISEITINIMK